MDSDDLAQYDKALDVMLHSVETALDAMPTQAFASTGIVTATVPIPTPVDGQFGSHLVERLGQLLAGQGFTIGYTLGADSLTLTRTVSAGETFADGQIRISRSPIGDPRGKDLRVVALLDALIIALDVGLYDDWSRTEILAAMGLVLAVVRAIQQIRGED